MGFAYVEEVPVTDAVLVASTVAEDDYPVLGDSPTSDYDIGVRVMTPSTHQVWESTKDNNATDPLNPGVGAEDDWTLVGSTNRWKMFDQSPQSLTTAPGTMSVELIPAEYVNALALLEVDAATVMVQGLIELTGEIYSETYDMVSDEGILDYEPYFFWPVERKSELYINDLKPFLEAKWVVTFDSADGEDVACGVLKIGREIVLGNTAWGGRVGIDDYSIKQIDGFNQASILERAYNRTGDYNLFFTPAQVSPAYRRLSLLRATPVVWVADPDYGAALIYGFVNDFEIQFGPTLSFGNVSIRGLA